MFKDNFTSSFNCFSMSTLVENLKCIFCDEVFDDKEVFQEHFRKHGDPTFDKTSKNKQKIQNEVPTSTEKIEENEHVGCDVCKQVFPTISKAITHKHKVHPDHDAKYFCPWCGKLFTMKHLYNKHMQTNHNGLTNDNEKGFHCDSCSVNFYIPSAMLHHNKFFHRQDTDLNSIGSSKKVKLFNQELIFMYYCPFCGEEYNNKVNLHKHMEDDHEDENKTPEDVLRCPLCESFYYHLDAYELHLTFHSSDDLYSEQNELVNEITEFSLEAVPPIMEKVEDAAIDSVNNFLETIMDTAEEVCKVKTKKHKKHKKSKKEAITLDEFLNMNKDVFGDGLNVQGIEEVPTQMVLKKKFKGKKVANSMETKSLNADLSKLKKHGIIIKTKSNQNSPLQRVVTKHTNEHKSSTNPVVKPDPNDVITKLLRQGNNQIKIVKKSIAVDNENKQESYQSNQIDSSSDYDKSLENVSQVFKTIDEDLSKNKDEINGDKEIEAEYKNEETHEDSNEDNCDKQSNSNNVSENCMNNPSATGIDIDDGITANFKYSTLKPLQNMGSQLTIKCLNQRNAPITSDTTNNTTHKSDEDNNDDNSDNNNVDDENHDNTKEIFNSENTHKIKDNSEESRKDAIKPSNFNEGITVKAVHEKQGKIILDEEKQSIPNKLKSLSKFITIKAAGSTLFENNVHNDDLKEQEMCEDDCDLDNAKENSTAELQEKNVPATSYRYRKIGTNKSSVSQSHTDILKRLTNVTARPITVAKNISDPNKSISNPISSSKSEIPKNVSDNEIEILNIDDSDSDADGDNSDKSKRSNLNKPIYKPSHPKTNIVKNIPSHALHGSNKNVTVKSMSKQTSNYTEYQSKSTGQNCKNTVINRNYESKNVNIMRSSNINKLAEEHKNLQNTIKNLRRHVTIKPNNSAQLFESQSSDEDNIDDGKHEDAEEEQDSDSSVDRVKITELNENVSDTEHQSDGDTGPRIESPHDSNSEEERRDHDTEEELSDIESKIKVNPIRNTKQQYSKSANQPPKSPNLSFLNKEVTIKSVNPDRQLSDDEINCDITPETSGVEANVPARKSNIKPMLNKNMQMSRNIQSSHKTSTSSNQVSTVKTVKTYQSQTVIEEVTTTVTKTIRTVNTQQEVQNTSQNRQMRPQKIVTKPVNNIAGSAVRQTSPAIGTKIRNSVPISQTKPNTNSKVIRPSNMVVPVRPRLNSPRFQNTPNVRKFTPAPQNKPRLSCPTSTPIKVSPHAIPSTSTKRPPEESSGHFSCFKKPKESLIPVQDIPNVGEDETVHYSSQTSSSFKNVTKILKGNNVGTTSQTKSEATSTSQQQIAKLSGMSGIKIVKTSAQQKQVEEKHETNTPINSTLAALEKLQKQGLLIKKPKLDKPGTEDDVCSHSGSGEE